MKTSRSVFVAVVLLAIQSAAQVVKPPYILGKNNVRIKSKNFLVGRRPKFGSTYEIFNKAALIYFDKKTNEFEVVTGAENSSRSIEKAKQALHNAERVLLAITGVAARDKCQLKVLMRIVVPDSTDGGVSWNYLPSCGEF